MNWHKWYHSQWLSSLTRLQSKLDGRGLYRDLLDFSYQEGGIPEDRDYLIRISATTPEEFDRAWAQISHKFESDPKRPGWLFNAKVGEVLSESGYSSEQQRLRARKRWDKRDQSGNAVASIRHQSGNAAAYAETIPKEEEEEETHGASDDATVGDSLLFAVEGSAEKLRGMDALKELGWTTVAKLSDTVADRIASMEASDFDVSSSSKSAFQIWKRIVDFRAIWEDYWRKDAKRAALIAFFRAVESDPESITGQIEAAVEAQTQKMLDRPRDKRPQFGNWLRDERWHDGADEQS
jgi:hypothetical protein